MTPANPSGGLPRGLAAALLHPWTWRMAWRDSRTQRKRLAIFALSIIAGISALVAIHSLKSSALTAVETEAKSLLGSDLEITSRQPFPEETVARIVARAHESSRETDFSSMLYFPGADAARLVQVRGIEGGYPFYGAVETVPAGAWAAVRERSGILLEPAMLDQFHAKVGDTVKLGALELPILGALTKTPPRAGRFAGIAPEAYVRMGDLAKTGLLSKSSLSSHRLHLVLSDPKDAAAIRRDFANSAWHFETPKDRRDSLGSALDNFQQFLGLVALAALALGAIGVAGAIHAHIGRRTAVVAVLRCLGCPGNVAFAIYLIQAMILGLLGALVGAVFGMILHWGAVTLFGRSLPISIDASPQWAAIAKTTAVGLAVCGGFALLPLLRVRRISPLALLRSGAAVESGGIRAALHAWPLYLFLTFLLAALSVLDTSHRLRALGMIGGLAAAFLLLAGVAGALMWLARRLLRPSWPYLLRQGVSNLYRPHNQTLLFLLSIGLGTFLLATILLTRNLLLSDLKIKDLADSPNIYLVDVQADQLDGVTGLVRSLQLPVLETCPMVTMRIASVRGVPTEELAKQKTIPKWVLQREFRSSYRDQLTSTENLAAGQWFSGTVDPNAPVPLSLETDIAKDLHVGVGDEIGLDVQGVPLVAQVVNLRKVDWSRFNLNFFMIFPPGVLENAPGFDVVTTRVGAQTTSGDLQRALVHQFPNVSAIDLTLILAKVQSIISQISQAVTGLAGAAVLAGLPILIGTLLNGRGQRQRESVLLRTLGASSRQVGGILLVEYTALGALSALSALALAVAANVGMAIFVFKANPWPDWRLLAVTFVAATGLAVGAGLLLGRGISRHPPLQILRGLG